MEHTLDSKMRELLMLQIGSQILALCEANAKLELVTAQLAEQAKPKPKKAGTE